MTLTWLRAHPVLVYFLLTFFISWGGILVVFARHGFDLSPLGIQETGLLLLPMLLGPSMSGLLLTALIDGRTGLQAIGGRLKLWRVPTQWYGVALLTIPLTLLAILLIFASTVDPAYAPRFQWVLLVAGLVAAPFEEIGWKGFATPRLLARYGLGLGGLILGLVWALWHLLVDFRYNAGAMGIIWPLEFAIVYIATLTPYRILMTWVYARTRSLLLAVLMHASFTSWLMVLFPQTSTPQSLLWQAVFGLVLWVLVAGALIRHGAGRNNAPVPALQGAVR